MTNIIFVQDLPGERSWLEKKIPGCTNYGNFRSDQWPSRYPGDRDECSIWEVPADCKEDTTGWVGKKFKSLFDPDHTCFDDRWVDADHLLFEQHHFSQGSRSKKALVFHLPRSGTGFLESILDNHCDYERIKGRGQPVVRVLSGHTTTFHNNHHIPHNPNFTIPGSENYGKIDYEIMSTERPDVFFVYRRNWWEWITSNIIANHVGAFHHDSMPDHFQPSPIKLEETEIENLVDSVRYAFNNLCEMRCRFRDLNFYIFEFNDLIKNQGLTNHRKIKYNKQMFFPDHIEFQELFYKKYQDKLDRYERRCISHLTEMGCQISHNFDDIHSANQV